MLLDLLFPNRCLHCNRIISGEEIVCELCLGQINFTHHQFEENNILKERCKLLFPLEKAFALMQFEKEGLSQKIIHSLKYGNREKVGKILAEWTSERLNFENEKIDLIATVPLHPKKQRKRGYNQLHWFADTLSKNFEIPVNHQLLKRNFSDKSQATKDKIHRSETVNLFSLNKEISGKNILLIDDVLTTGNTLSSIAWEILKSGNNKVSVLVMAID